MLQDGWHYIVLLGAVIIVAAFALPKSKKAAPAEPQSIQNMETALEQFMENMEKDNEELAQLVIKAQKEAKAEAAQKERQLEELRQQLQQAAERIALLESRPIQTIQPVQPVQPLAAGHVEAAAIEPKDEIVPEAEAPAKETIRSRYAELFQLYEEGKSIEAISRKLGIHKGEISLIMGLAKQEESANVK